MALRLPNFAFSLRVIGARAMSGEYGSGAGKGGGAGGTIRDAGGAFGKMEAAHEEQYFRKLHDEQMKAYKEIMQEEKHFHGSEIKRHEEAIARHKKRIQDIEKKHEKGSDSD